MNRGCHLLVPNGSLEKAVHELLAEAGIPIRYREQRNYRGKIGNSHLFPKPFDWAKKMRPQDATWVVADRKADLGFTGDDLIVESGRADELLVLRRYPLSRGGVGKIRIVVAVPDKSSIQTIDEITPNCELVTEYPRLATNWLSERGIKPRIRRCHGSTEAFGSDENGSKIADVIVENTETGESLSIGEWRIIAEIMESQLCLFTHRNSSEFRKWVEDEFCVLLDSVVTARSRRLLKCNVITDRLKEVLAIMPAANSPTVNKLAGGKGLALESIIGADQIKGLIPRLIKAGATAIIELPMAKFVP